MLTNYKLRRILAIRCDCSMRTLAHPDDNIGVLDEVPRNHDLVSTRLLLL